MICRVIVAVSVFLLAGCNNTGAENADQRDSTDVSSTQMMPPAAEGNADSSGTSGSGGVTAVPTSESTTLLVRLTLRDIYKADLEKGLVDSFSRSFIYFEIDLNDDGKREILVGLRGPYFCGSGGCTQYILDHHGDIVSKFTVADYPVLIGEQKTRGWKDLAINSNGKYHQVVFDGRKYPANPSVLPALQGVPDSGWVKALDFVNEPYTWFTF